MKKNILVVLALLIAQVTFAQYTDQSNWSHRGPFKYGTGKYETGRLDVIALHPGYNGTSNKIIFAGGSNGGLWKTIDGGLNWINIPTNFMRYSGIGDMAFTSDGLYLYIADRIAAGTGEDRGSGVYRYTVSNGDWIEAGTSQSLTLTTALGERLKNNHLKIHPTDNATLYLATNTGLYVSNTGGTTSWGSTPRVTGNFENIAFVPNATATGGYDIYISGMNTIMKSSDKGATFIAIPTPSPNNPFTTYISPYFDMTYGGIDTDGASKIIYFYGWVSSPSAKYILYKYTIPTTGSPTMTFLLQDIGSYPRYSEIDRLCVAGDKNSVYFGGTNLVKYKISNNMVYDPIPTPNGTDVALGAGSFPAYYFGGSEPYLTMMHPDLHDIKVYDDGTIRKIFVVHDGGFSENTYDITPTAGIYTNSWIYRNNGLHIATVGGFSGSDTDTDVYTTAEQDTKGFVFKENMSKIVSFEVEPHMALLDKTKKKNALGHDVYRVFHNTGFHNQDYKTSDVDFDINVSPATGTISSSSTNIYQCDPTASYFLPSNTVSAKYHSPYSKAIYQDPARAKQIYILGDGLWQWDETTQKFGAKYVLGKFLSYPDPIRDHPYQWLNSVAISRTNKNKIYLASDADNNSLAAHIYRYTGPDIDNSWDGHNDTNWDLITPDLNAAPFSLNLSIPEIVHITYNSMLMSDWDDNKLFVIACGETFLNIANHPDIKVLKYENGSWTNYSQGIPLTEAAQTMVYEHGSNDGIYLSTERNMYYRNSFMSQWEVFNSSSNPTPLPHVFTRQTEINYTENTLRAGTWGRGIWKSNLNCLNPGIDPVVPSSCNNCNDATHYFWQAATISLSNTTLTLNKQIVRALTSIDILPETTIDPSGNSNVYYEFFIHGCGGVNGNSYRVYQNPDMTPDSEEEEEEEKFEIEHSISAYPNPNNGSFTLNTGTLETKDVYVYNALGKIVYQRNKVSEKTLDINISNTPKGIYLIKVISDEGAETVKIINQ